MESGTASGTVRGQCPRGSALSHCTVDDGFTNAGRGVGGGGGGGVGGGGAQTHEGILQFALAPAAFASASEIGKGE